MRHRGRLPLALLLLAGMPSQGHALGVAGPPPFVKAIERSALELSLHPFTRGFSLSQDATVAPEAAGAALLRNALSNPLVGIRAQPSAVGFGLRTGITSYDYEFHVAGIPLCRFHARYHVLADGSAMLLGTAPRIDPSERLPSTRHEDWPDRALTLERVAAALADAGETIREKGARRCFHVQHGSLLPAWDLTVAVDGLPWKAVADGYEVIALERGYFDVAGKARVHPNNVLNDEPVEVDLADLAGDGSLTSEFIRTVVPAQYQRAVEPTHVYAYPKTDQRYDEVAAYYYTQRHYAFVKSLGFSWYGPKPLSVRLHVRPAGRKNNALFVPGDASQNTVPTISIDDGDGIELQNLGTDADVVSHEFGHHVIYATLRTTEGQALVLHEGLADFFAFLRSGDPCLGESICPTNSPACVLQAQCLRTADPARLTLAYKDKLWDHWAGGSRNRLGHLHGQLVSGMLWELTATKQIPGTDLGRIVMKAISLFKMDSGLKDLMLALFLADRELFAGKYFAKLYAAGEARGLGEYLEDVPADGQGALPEPKGTGTARGAPLGAQTEQAAGSASGGTKRESGGENPMRCGVLGEGVDASTAAALLGLLLPLAGALAAQARPALAKAKAKPKKPRRD